MRFPILQQHNKPHLRVGSAVSVPIKDAPSSAHSKDRIGDDGCIIVRDRKVRITERASLYRLCRSWLRNGYLEESQPQNENWNCLPKPLLIPVVSNTLSQKAYDEDDEDEEVIQHLSPKDLLKRHVNHARKVRARLQEARLQRIACYKTRLALLLLPRPAEHAV